MSPLSRCVRSRTAAAGAIRNVPMAIPAVALDVVDGVELERRIPREEEVLEEGGARLSALQLPQQCLAFHAAVEEIAVDDVPVSGDRSGGKAQLYFLCSTCFFL